MKYLSKKTVQTGDTIVEVLIAIVVVAAVLAGAYVSANRSTNTTVRSREHDEGVKLAQSQLEALRLRMGRDPLTVTSIPVGQLFCFYVDGDTTEIQTFSGGNYTRGSLPENIENTDPELYEENCRFNSGGGIYDVGTDNGAMYLTAITKDPPPGSGDTDLYEVSMRWRKVGGGWDQAEFLYRIYP